MPVSHAVPYSAAIRTEDTDRAPLTLRATLYPNEQRPRAVDFDGACPRCGHEMHQRAWLVAFHAAARMTNEQREQLMDALDATGDDRSSGNRDFDLVCECGQTHPQTPPGKSGCGATFSLNVRWP